MKKSKFIITLAAVIATVSLITAPKSPVTIKASAYNEHYKGTYEDVKKSVSPKGTIIKDEYENLKYRIIRPFSPSTGYIDKWSGSYVLNLDEIPGEVEIVGRIHPKEPTYGGSVSIRIVRYLSTGLKGAPKLADGQEQTFYVTRIAKGAFKNDCADGFSIENYPYDYHYVGSETLVIPDGAFKNCKKLKTVQISAAEVRFEGKAFENAPINTFNIFGNGRYNAYGAPTDFDEPVKWIAKKNTFKKIKSNNIKVEVFLSDYTSKKTSIKTGKNIRSALIKGGIKKGKIYAQYQYKGKMRKIK